MEKLSEELLRAIVDHLDDRTLLRFSLVSRRFRCTCLPRLFWTVRLSFSSPETLIAEIHTAEGYLRGGAYLKCVRHLEVVPAFTILYANRVDAMGDRGNREHQGDPWRYLYCLINESETEYLTDDLQWAPLAEFIKSLPLLMELTWACEEQLPLFILRYLHTLLPRCRLHMRRFDLRSLAQTNGKQIEISAEDVEIATSPCLYSICRRYGYSGYNNLNNDAILEIAGGGAPNLKELYLWNYHGGSDPWSVAASRLPRQSLRPGSIRSSPLMTSSLEVLVLSSLDTNILRRMNRFTDFSSLRRLQLSLEKDDVEWLTSSCQFSALEELILMTDPDLQSEGLAFILSLPPLQSITLYESYDTVSLAAILEHCGNHLRRFHGIDVFFDLDLAQKLLHNCPQIEDLRLNVYRSGGSAEEVALYHCLGTLPALQELELGICSVPELEGDIENLGREMSDRMEDVHRLLKDLAVDKNLAGSIFHTISSSKPQWSWPLESLVLRVAAFKYQSGYESTSELVQILWYVGRPWICKRSIGGGNTHGCEVEDYDAEDKLRYEEYDEDGIPESILQGRYGPAIHHVWPQSRNGAIKDVWHSFPLCTEGA
nr:hypothetical protein CFP56_77664 [Quercus suber]